jgi:nitrogenase molybdenum-iron protein beta chain
LVEKVIAAEEANFYGHLSTLADCYTDMDLQRHAVIVGDVNYASALPQFLADDLGWLPELVVYTDQLDDDQKERLTRRYDRLPEGLRPRIVFETDTTQVLTHFRKFWPAVDGQPYYTGLGTGGGATFVIGSSLDRAFAGAIGAGHLSVSFPVANRAVLDRGYTGYVGGLRLVEDLLSSVVAAR